ncbi:CBS domain-containing protein [Candidatus Nitrosarchaeum limnium]|jgi:CBS domain-containing protein|uniref:CBS domain protein n=1 Tax=Candidatus Nitrosarchaeum limnium BG20 TaxID=859192 RepID=S2EMM3_9ARCH|nr:CBS domain-containing protein [Candidatus Nitrosarchaeum limnium]EPA05777.1 CBS domain protein [Candidatus Nitrosarchaeum limnium BG20]
MSDSEKTKISINNFMTRNIKSIQSNTSVKDASKIMYESHIPSLVVQDSEEILGIVTYEDIAVALTIYENKPETEIKEIMSSPIISVKSDASILDAVELMLAKKIHELPVIDDGKIKGIISSTDLIVLLSMINEEHLYEVVRGQISK